MRVLEATTPSIIPSEYIQENKSSISAKTIKERIALQTRVQGIIWLMLEKMRVWSPNSLSQIPDSITTMFDSIQWEQYVFRVGAHMKFHLPWEFIEATDTVNNQSFDNLIKNWIFLIDGREIPVMDWIDHDVINTLVKDSKARTVKAMDLAWLPPERINEIEEKKVKLTELLRSKLASLVTTLLPKEEQRKRPSGSSFPTFLKNSVVTVVPRGKNKN
jgi:hypothetical protein